MGFRVTLRYPDGGEIGSPSDVEVDALPPIGAEVNIVGRPWTVGQISLSVPGDGKGYYTVVLHGFPIR
jgi:hypothetical protein